MLSVPLAQVPLDVVEAVMVALPPAAPKVAVFPENDTTEVSLEAQVVELVTSVLFNVAVKVAVELAAYAGPLGMEVMVSVWALPPVVLPVIEP